MSEPTKRCPVILNADEAAAVLRVSRDTVYAKARDGSLPHLRIGRRVVFPEDLLTEWIYANAHRPAEPLSGHADVGPGADPPYQARADERDRGPIALRPLPPLPEDR